MTLIQRNSARVVPWNSILFCSRKYSRGGTSFLSFFSLLFPLVHARETFPLAERVFQPGKNVSFYQRIGGRAEGAAGSRGWLCKIHSTIRQARETNVHFYTYIRREVSILVTRILVTRRKIDPAQLENRPASIDFTT